MNPTRVFLILAAALSCRNDAWAQNATPPTSSGTPSLPDIVIAAPATFQNKVQAFDQSRDNFLLPKIGATSFANVTSLAGVSAALVVATRPPIIPNPPPLCTHVGHAIADKVPEVFPNSDIMQGYGSRYCI